MIPVVAVVGPTAVGKTALSIKLAQCFQGEIINADSRQVYRGMDIGTAKPGPEERRGVLHHLLDIRDPSCPFDLGTFLSLARSSIECIHSRGMLPFVVGGSGQYLWGLLEGWEAPPAPPDPEFRRAKQSQAEQQGAASLYQELQRLDPDRASQLDPRNLRRVIRALEVHHVTGDLPSALQSRSSPPYSFLIIGLTMSRECLYRRIDQRVDGMIARGFLGEVVRLSEKGHEPGVGPLNGPGYLELGLYLDGTISLAEAVQRTKFQTHRLARRQHSWFKPSDPRIHWLDASDPQVEEQAAALTEAFRQVR